jgi:hypothetical protein
MEFKEIESLFNKKFKEFQKTISELSRDINTQVSLCNFKKKYLSLDDIAKLYGPSISSCDMIFFAKDSIVLVEFKAGQIEKKTDAKRKIKQKMLDSFALLFAILKISKLEFWNLRTYFVLVTDKRKNSGQLNRQSYMGAEQVLSYLT